ncbi:hypothetical protein ACFFNY_27235 [Paenibacillus hodogayensis]|uniref:Terpene synthase n=1 Tax=Paenibacillus hodogayensis TaxID=279208 RepID=A0ABV5W4J6_9BACL
MNWLNGYEEELRKLFAEAREAIAQFPAPLDRRGLAYLQKFDPLQKESTKNYICYLLPYWVKEAAGADDDTCRRLALANVFVMLYYFIQDDLMDTVPSEWREQLALANLMQTRLLELYRPLFPAESPFWAYYRQYVEEWAASVSAENEPELFLREPLRIAHKASPVKFASTGLLLLTGRGDRIAPVSRLVEETLVTLQMADDRADWREDLELGSANCLLAMIRSERATSGALDVAEVKRAIYMEGVLGRYARVAEERHRLVSAAGTDVPELVGFHAFLTDHLVLSAESIERDLQLLKLGGFTYWSSKNVK